MMTEQQYSSLPAATDAQVEEATEAARDFLNGTSDYHSVLWPVRMALIEYHLYTHYGTRLNKGEQ